MHYEVEIVKFYSVLSDSVKLLLRLCKAASKHKSIAYNTGRWKIPILLQNASISNPVVLSYSFRVHVFFTASSKTLQ